MNPKERVEAESWKFDEIGASQGCPRVVELDESPVADLRGWGHLTGTGGLHLSHEEATEIQNERGRLMARAPGMARRIAALVKLRDELVENLCWYDPRRPDNGPSVQRMEDCACDPCYYGRHKLADKLLKIIDEPDSAGVE